MPDEALADSPGPWTAEIHGDATAPTVVVVVHGGNWRPDLTSEMTEPLSAALAAEGHWVWNIEYARPGMAGGGWPGTGLSVRAALRGAVTAARGRPVVAVGHSAGGHLALWAARDTDITGVVSLAGVTDLAKAAIEDGMRDDVAALLGGDPAQRPAAIADASPIESLPLGVPAILIHGAQDGLVPIERSRAYVAAARAAGDDAELVELPLADHSHVRNPDSEAWTTVRDCVARAAGR